MVTEIWWNSTGVEMKITRHWRDKTYSGMGKHTGRKIEGVPRRRTLDGFPICIGNFNTQAKIQKIEWASSDWRKNLTMLSAAGRSGQCKILSGSLAEGRLGSQTLQVWKKRVAVWRILKIGTTFSRGVSNCPQYLVVDYLCISFHFW